MCKLKFCYLLKDNQVLTEVYLATNNKIMGFVKWCGWINNTKVKMELCFAFIVA